MYGPNYIVEGCIIDWADFAETSERDDIFFVTEN